MLLEFPFIIYKLNCVKVNTYEFTSRNWKRQGHERKAGPFMCQSPSKPPSCALTGSLSAAGAGEYWLALLVVAVGIQVAHRGPVSWRGLLAQSPGDHQLQPSTSPKGRTDSHSFLHPSKSHKPWSLQLSQQTPGTGTAGWWGLSITHGWHIISMHYRKSWRRAARICRGQPRKSMNVVSDVRWAWCLKTSEGLLCSSGISLPSWGWDLCLIAVCDNWFLTSHFQGTM